MDIIFETNGTTKPFEDWLKSFTEIDDSLLLEIDPVESLFIAKSFTTDKTIVKYGKISFEACNLGLPNFNLDDGRTVSISEWTEEHKERIYVGLQHTLKQFIQTSEKFSDEEEHKIIFRFNKVDIDGYGPMFMVNKIEFKSRSLTMLSRGYNLADFNLMLLDDNKFNGVANIPNSVRFEYGADVHTTLLKVAEVNSSDPKKDVVFFDIKPFEGSHCLTAHDKNGEYYNYRMSHKLRGDDELGDVEIQETSSPISRSNYIIANKGSNAKNYIMTVSAVEKPNGRIKIETEDGSFVTIIANVRM